MSLRRKQHKNNATLSRKQFWFLVRRGYDRRTIQRWTVNRASREIGKIVREDTAAQKGHAALDIEFDALVRGGAF